MKKNIRRVINDAAELVGLLRMMKESRIVNLKERLDREMAAGNRVEVLESGDLGASAKFSGLISEPAFIAGFLFVLGIFALMLAAK